MPTNRLAEFILRLESLEGKVEKHLEDGILVIKSIEKLNTDMFWVKWLSMGIASGLGAIIVGLVIWAIRH